MAEFFGTKYAKCAFMRVQKEAVIFDN